MPFYDPVMDALRRRRIFDPDNQGGLQPVKLWQQPDSGYQAPQQEQDQTPEPSFPQMSAYSQALARAPREQDYPISRTRNILGGIGAGLTGAFMGPQAGAMVGHEIRRGPYMTAQRQYQQNLQPLQEQAAMEYQQRKLRSDEMLRRAQMQHMGAQTQAEQAKARESDYNISDVGAQRKFYGTAGARPVNVGGTMVARDFGGGFTQNKISDSPSDIAAANRASREKIADITNQRAYQSHLDQVDRFNKMFSQRESHFQQGQANADKRQSRSIEAANQRQQTAIANRGSGSKMSQTQLKQAFKNIASSMINDHPEYEEFFNIGDMTMKTPGEYNTGPKSWLPGSSAKLLQKHKEVWEEFKRRVHQATGKTYEELTGEAAGAGSVGPPVADSGDTDTGEDTYQ